MMGFGRVWARAFLAVAVTAAAAVGAAGCAPSRAWAAAAVETGPSLKVLSPADAQRYGQAFSAMQRGDFIGGQTSEHGIADPCLIGRLEAIRLLHPAYRASYAELSAWMDRNADLPEAERVYDLAQKRKPAHAPPLRAPVVVALDEAAALAASPGRTGVSNPPAASRAANPRQQAARAAFYGGDMDKAYALASTSGERWIAGLSALRLKRYPDALKNLTDQAGDPRQNPWSRSAAAYWASRAALAQGDAARAHDLVKLAARAPDTFYGLIAGRELEQQAAKPLRSGAAAADPIGDVLAAAAVDGRTVAMLARTNPQARRAAALMQIGLPLEAGQDLKGALAAASPAERPALTSLALALNAPMSAKVDVARAGWAQFDLGHFPTPPLRPRGGFTIDKALVYALVRQESRFDPNIISGSGAYGLMQLTAETAALMAGDQGLRRNPGALRDPALNLRLGQDYVAKLLTSMKGDMVKAVAAYNCGPGMLQRMTARMGQDMDSLLMVESMPSGQTRDYVQRVMAGYWIYRQIFGLDSRTLDAAASGQRTLASADL